jgi:hypothetical protein
VIQVPTTEPKAPTIDPETAAKPAINQFMDGISTCYHACADQTVTSSRASTEISALKSLDTGQPVWAALTAASNLLGWRQEPELTSGDGFS